MACANSMHAMDETTATVSRFTGMGTWEREARRIALLAAEQYLPLDEEALLLYDVRELSALRRRLESARR